jgi:hypothetical protein
VGLASRLEAGQTEYDEDHEGDHADDGLHSLVWGLSTHSG